MIFGLVFEEFLEPKQEVFEGIRVTVQMDVSHFFVPGLDVLVNQFFDDVGEPLIDVRGRVLYVHGRVLSQEGSRVGT
jgi:hypothetical protein